MGCAVCKAVPLEGGQTKEATRKATVVVAHGEGNREGGGGRHGSAVVGPHPLKAGEVDEAHSQQPTLPSGGVPPKVRAHGLSTSSQSSFPPNAAVDAAAANAAGTLRQPTNAVRDSSTAAASAGLVAVSPTQGVPGGAAQTSILTSRVHRKGTLAESYTMSNHILGTGISGAVRVATCKATGRQYAIKTLSLQKISAKKAAMLHNEVSIYLKLDHPNIVKLIEVYEEQHAVHLVMELCEGGELYDRLALKKRFTEAEAASVTSQMLEAVNYCHCHRICHRDLKLENWVYAGKEDSSRLKLIDFGFSRIFNPGIPMTAMHGTVYYVSPEVMDGCYKESCDIWSIGVIVYMLLSGSPPFNGGPDQEILIKIKKTDYSFEGVRWVGISSLAKDFIRHLLVENPDKRPTASEALKHPWLAKHRLSLSLEVDLNILSQMRRFALAHVMRRAALGIVALTVTPQETRNIENQFKLLDRSGSGTIQLDELCSVLSEKLNMSGDEAMQIFSLLDQSGDREVHYSEFVASTYAVRLLREDLFIQDAFRRFDVDKNGVITVDDLRQVLGDAYTGTKVEDIVSACDLKGDNLIDFDEFVEAVREPVEA